MIRQHSKLQTVHGKIICQVMILERRHTTGMKMQDIAGAVAAGRTFSAARDVAVKMYKISLLRRRPAPVKPGGRRRLMLRWR